MLIGLIGAMDLEVDTLKEIMDNYQVETISTVEFCIGMIHGVKAVVAVSGVGKVNAAVCAQTMILKYHPNCIINIGVAGGMNHQLEIGDIVVADRVVEHDMDTSPIGDPKGFITGLNQVYMNTDAEMTKRIYESAKKIQDIHVYCGTIASGDQFIAGGAARERIKENFENVYAAEMEGASIGHVCTMNQVPFGVLRAISDGANSDSTMSFPQFAKMAAEHSVLIMLMVMDALKKGE